jgi:hypothetical protein
MVLTMFVCLYIDLKLYKGVCLYEFMKYLNACLYLCIDLKLYNICSHV